MLLLSVVTVVVTETARSSETALLYQNTEHQFPEEKNLKFGKMTCRKII